MTVDGELLAGNLIPPGVPGKTYLVEVELG